MARRFTDEDLTEMHDELRDLSKRFDEHEAKESKKFDAMISAVHQNTTSIDKLTDETRAIVELHRDIQGTARVGKSLQSAMIWLAKWGVVGTALAAFIKWALDLDP